MSTDEKKLARAILDLAHCISSARESRSLSVEELATRTGLEVIDIEMIEEGDVSDTSILMRVLDALDAQVELGAGFRVAFSSTVAALPLARRLRPRRGVVVHVLPDTGIP